MAWKKYLSSKKKAIYEIYEKKKKIVKDSEIEDRK